MIVFPGQNFISYSRPARSFLISWSTESTSLPSPQILSRSSWLRRWISLHAGTCVLLIRLFIYIFQSHAVTVTCTKDSDVFYHFYSLFSHPFDNILIVHSSWIKRNTEFSNFRHEWERNDYSSDAPRVHSAYLFRHSLVVLPACDHLRQAWHCKAVWSPFLLWSPPTSTNLSLVVTAWAMITNNQRVIFRDHLQPRLPACLLDYELNTRKT